MKKKKENWMHDRGYDPLCGKYRGTHTCTHMHTHGKMNGLEEWQDERPLYSIQLCLYVLEKNHENQRFSSTIHVSIKVNMLQDIFDKKYNKDLGTKNSRWLLRENKDLNSRS